VPDWSEWSWIEQGVTLSIDAGSSDDITLFTVPSDERAVLDGVQVTRDSGDNTWIELHMTNPADYGAGTAEYHLLHLETADADIYWPDAAQANTRHVAGPAPILLEPGTFVALAPSGAGVSASVASYRILMRRRKIIRSLAP